MHIRRRFEKAAKLGEARAAIALGYFRKIHAIEAACKAEGLSHGERLVRRQAESLPLVNELYGWIEAIHPTLVPRMKLQDATRYALNQKDGWLRCFADGRFEIDNGEVERQLRRVVLGRKNYLFAGSDRGALRADRPGGGVVGRGDTQRSSGFVVKTRCRWCRARVTSGNVVIADPLRAPAAPGDLSGTRRVELRNE